MIPARRQACLKSSEPQSSLVLMRAWGRVFRAGRGAFDRRGRKERPPRTPTNKIKRFAQRPLRLFSACSAVKGFSPSAGGRLDTIVGILTLVLLEKLGVPHALRDGIFLHTCRLQCGQRELGSGSKYQPQGAIHAIYVLSALQARDRGRTEVGSGVHVCADRRSEAAAEVGGAEDLLLSAMRGVAGHGTAARGSAEHGGLGDDPRLGELGAFVELRGLGGLAKRGRTAGFR